MGVATTGPRPQARPEAESDPLEAVQGLAPDDPVRIDALLERVYTLRMDDRPQAAALNREALDLSEARGYLPGIANALRLETMLFYTIGSIDEMTRIARRSAEIFEFLGDKKGLAAAKDRLASMYELAGDFSKALDCALRTRELARELGDRPREGWALSSLGGIYSALDEFDNALGHLQQALQIFEDLDNDSGRFRILLRLSRMYRRQGRYDDAIDMAEKALARTDRVEDDLFRAICLADLGLIAERMGDLEQARRLLEESLDIFPDWMKSTVALETQLGLGRVSHQLKDLTQAREILEPVAAMAEQVGAVPLAAEAHKTLAEVFEELKQPHLALSAFKKHMVARERVFDTKTRQALTRMEVQLQTEAAKKDAEIERLKFVELQNMQSRLVESERMATVGDLAAGITHEINSPLGVLASNLDLVERVLHRLPDVEAGRVDVERVSQPMHSGLRASREALQRVQELVQSLRRFARLDEAEYQRVDLVANVDSVLTLFRPQLPDAIGLLPTLDPVPAFWGYPGELNQALMALLRNAQEAIEGDGGTGQIRLRTFTDGEDAVIEIEDSGPGIPTDRLSRLFQIGFGQKGPRMRLRLGLSTVASVVRKHGGTIDVRSELGQGTTFILRFSAAGAGPERSSELPPPAA